MSLITTMRVMDAVWWERGAVADEGGEFTFQHAVAIKCFWTANNEQFIAPDGKTITAKSVVYVDRVMKPGDVLKLVTLASLTTEQRESNDPERVGGDEIKVFAQFPDWNANEFLYMAVL